MKWGLYGLHKGTSVDPDVLARRARRAEAVGFESLWTGDHVALPVDAPDPPDEPRLELVAGLAHLAALTSRVRLATGVAVLPQRHPVLLAKQLASIDVLSGGRLIVGIGVGHVGAELTALGASTTDRGARTDEHLAAMLALWDEPTPSFDGRFVSFSGVVSRPRPVQRPHPPIVVGGHAPASFRRAAEVADGWYGWELDPDQAAAAIAALHDAGRAVGRAVGRPVGRPSLEITITPPPHFDADMARRYAEVGVHRLVVQPQTSDGTEIDDLIESTARLIGDA